MSVLVKIIILGLDVILLLSFSSNSDGKKSRELLVKISTTMKTSDSVTREPETDSPWDGEIVP